MRTSPVEQSETAVRLSVLAQAEGSAACPLPPRLLGRQATTRDLADAIHFLCMLHGRHPGLVDLALERAGPSPVLPWLEAASAGFATERLYITRLVVAVGPLPSTVGQADCEAAVIGQHHALDTLARSDRAGTAFGAAFALALDWAAIRPVLDAAADRCGVDIVPSTVPNTAATCAAIDLAVGSHGLARAIGFGAQQLYVQHRGLWDLLEARAGARIV